MAVIDRPALLHTDLRLETARFLTQNYKREIQKSAHFPLPNECDIVKQNVFLSLRGGIVRGAVLAKKRICYSITQCIALRPYAHNRWCLFTWHLLHRMVKVGYIFSLKKKKQVGGQMRFTHTDPKKSANIGDGEGNHRFGNHYLNAGCYSFHHQAPPHAQDVSEESPVMASVSRSPSIAIPKAATSASRANLAAANQPHNFPRLNRGAQNIYLKSWGMC